MIRRLLPALLSLACTGEPKESEPPPLDTKPTDTGEECLGGTPPVITDMWLENTGLDRYENDEYPTITVWVSATDEDWDLSTYTLDVSFDATVDGSVTPGDDNSFQSQGTISSDGACTAPEGTVGLKVFLAGGGIEYDALTEWGATITDTNSVVSEMATVSGYTPTSTGEDGGP